MPGVPNDRPRYSVEVAKSDLKFSAAHFTLFPDGRAEPLHGHDYRIRVRIEGDALGELGLLADLRRLKKHIRARCSRLDERVLLPAHAKAVSIDRVGDHVEVAWGDRRYRFPADEVVELALDNVSMERLAEMLWTEIAPALGDSAADILTVEVEETPGQSAAYREKLG